MWLLAAAGRSPAWALIYLWSPLAVTEFWIEGHNDALGVALAVAAIALSLRWRHTWALVLLTIATLCKFWPVVLFPFLALARSGGAGKCSGRGCWRAARLALRFAASTGTACRTSSRCWRASRWAGAITTACLPVLLWVAGGDMASAATAGRWILIACVAWLWWRRLPPCLGELGAVTALLLLSANCFPWYLSWMLPLLAVHPVRPLLLWTALAPLAYHVVPAYEATARGSTIPAWFSWSMYQSWLGWARWAS